MDYNELVWGCCNVFWMELDWVMNWGWIVVVLSWFKFGKSRKHSGRNVRFSLDCFCA